MNLPNKLTLARVILIPFMIAAFYMNFTGHYFVALAIFSVAAATDFLDGYIARKYNLITDFGKFLDPIADKVLVLAAFIVMLADPKPTNAFSYLGDICLILGGVGVTIIIAREMTVSTLRMVAAKNGVVLAADKSGKLKTFFTDITALILLACGDLFTLNAALGRVVDIVGLVCFGISVVLTVYSGINYLVKNREVFSEK